MQQLPWCLCLTSVYDLQIVVSQKSAPFYFSSCILGANVPVNSKIIIRCSVIASKFILSESHQKHIQLPTEGEKMSCAKTATSIKD